MAWYMLTRQLEKLAGERGRLDSLGYEVTPRHYDEALLIYVYGTGKAVDLGGREVRAGERGRIEDFSRIFNRHGRDKKSAFGELAGLYGESYYFYHLYGFSGVRL